jgi:hypothetical protein
MPARVIIETPAEHEAWLTKHQAAVTTTAAR